MTDVSYSGKTLEIANEAVEFEHSIKQVEEIEGTILVLLTSKGQPLVGPKNVIAFDANGDQRWIISEPEWSPKRFKSISTRGDSVRLRNMNGIVYDLDMETGDIEPNDWAK